MCLALLIEVIKEIKVLPLSTPSSILFSSPALHFPLSPRPSPLQHPLFSWVIPAPRWLTSRQRKKKTALCRDGWLLLTCCPRLGGGEPSCPGELLGGTRNLQSVTGLDPGEPRAHWPPLANALWGCTVAASPSPSPEPATEAARPPARDGPGALGASLRRCASPGNRGSERAARSGSERLSVCVSSSILLPRAHPAASGAHVGRVRAHRSPGGREDAQRHRGRGPGELGLLGKLLDAAGPPTPRPFLAPKFPSRSLGGIWGGKTLGWSWEAPKREPWRSGVENSPGRVAELGLEPGKGVWGWGDARWPAGGG